MRLIPSRRLAAFVLSSFLLALPAAAADGDGDPGAYLAARVAGGEADYSAAADWFARALMADPRNPVLLDSAIQSNIGLGNIPAAAEFARRLDAEGASSQASMLATLAEQAAKGDFAAILADAAKGRKVAVLLDGLTSAWAELGNGRVTEALAGFDALAATKGLEAFGLYHKALALASVGDFEGAEKILAGEAGGALRLMRRGTLAHVQILSQLERNTDAVALLDATYPRDADPGMEALRARLVAGETVPYDVAINATQGLAEVFFTLATALNGEAEDGYTLLFTRIATYLRPDHSDGLLMTANLLEAQNQFDLATAVYAQISPEDPAFYVAEIGRAQALYSAGKTEASLEALQALARSHPDVMAVPVALGDAMRREERFAEACTAYDAAVALVPVPEQRHWALFFSRGICRERTDRWADAEADLRKALELEPDQPQVLNYLGYSFIEKGENLDEALGMIQRAVAARPDQGYIIDSLAWAYYRLGRYAEAVEPMEQASLLEPVDPVVTDHLGDVYWAVGRKLEAQFQWRRALSYEPEEKDATRIRRKLEVGLDAVLAEEAAGGAPPAPAAENGD